jgi:hypothetical protein
MDTKQTFKLVGYYRLLSWLSFGVGMALVALGVYLGLGETISILLADFPAEFDAAIAAASPVITVALSVLGIVVWQLGKSIALTRTMARAIAVEDSGSDDEQLKSEVLDVVNDQLSSVEKDLRSDIRELEREVGSGDDAPSAGRGVSTGSGAATSSTSRSSRSASGADGRSGASGDGSDAAGSGSGSRRSSSRSGSDRTSRSERSGSSSRSGESGSSKPATDSDDGDPDDDGRSERATDAVSGDGEKRSRRKQESDDDDDPLP